MESVTNRSMDLCKILLFLCILLCCSSSEAQNNNNIPVYIYHNCSFGGNTSAGSAFQSNLGTLLSSLSSNTESRFYNATVLGKKNPLDSVFGLFMCRGDVPLQLCQACVHNASQRLSSQCPLAKQSVIWYDECMVRYSNHSFFSTFDTRPRVGLLNTANISNQESFMPLLFRTINTTADEAARGNDKFATKQANISEFQSLYCLAQCTPDLSPQDCRACLSGVIGDLPWCCQGKQGGRVLYPSCNVRYELYPFYRSTTNTQFSQDPIYVNHNCSTTVTVTANSSFIINLKTLLSYMSSNATNGVKSYKDSVENTVYGLFMCRGDLHFSQSQICQQCVLNATQRISSECNSFQEAIIWYTHCMLRYSNRHFFSQVEKNPSFQTLNVIVLTASQGQAFLNFSLSNMVLELAEAAGDTAERYATKSLKLDDSETLYTLAQCTQDLSANHCKGCLQDINTKIPWSSLGSMAGSVLYPSCNLRFELFPFYSDDHETQWPMPDNPSPPTHKETRKGLLRTMILIIVLTIVSVSLFFLGYYLVKRKTKKSIPNILRENFGVESATLEPLQFSLAVIEAATNNFSNENKIGKGGFGEVYKGILIDGRQIAVKRLSKSSKQGENEFKNEILLIAKLQHRNLVTFIGFCFEEQDRVLIYEYVPNKSLDYFLFDSNRSKLLSWFERYNIIKGIVRGVLYLHDLSRLKVIHRDLKPSNVLLDENMIPKISDFGMARIVEIDEDEKSTNRIVGTYGYMSPEYAMFGQFSEKSDVFSFGIMLLEIITGKRNLSSYQPLLHLDDNNLLSYVWKQWRDQTPLIILDPNIKHDYSEMEVRKCIQIGLLCVQQNPGDRPTMLEVASYLSSYLIELPSPHEPAFFLHRRVDSKTFAQESSSNQSINASTPISINEISETQFFPR